MSPRLIPAAFVAAGALCATIAGAQTLRVEARRTAAPVVVDGALDEPAWRDAAPVSGFWKMRPVDDQAASESTQVRVLFDDQYLYLGFRAGEAHAGTVRGSLAPRDQCMDDDLVGVLIDTFHDHRRAYELFSNPLGVQADGVAAEGADDDFSIDLVWQSAARRSPDGYTVEMAIPFRSLRYPTQSRPTWGIAFVRGVVHATEQDAWPRIRRGVTCIMCQTADLTGLEVPRPARTLEVLPAVTGLRRGGSDPALARFAYDPYKYEAGVGVKLGFTPSLTGDLTANPDFSQVESDVAQVTVNRRFALFYPEKRPFFLEGQEIFASPITLVHTRTIYDPLGAAKITGKQGGTTLGVLGAVDEHPLEDGAPLDRSAQVSVARVKQDVGKSSTLGVLATDRELGAAHNRVAALDGVVELGKHWSWAWQAGGSDTRDAAGSRTGSAVYSNVGMNRDHADLGLEYTDFSPQFATQVGFVPRVDLREGAAEVGWQEKPDGKLLKRWRASVRGDQLYNHAGFREEQFVRPRLELYFARQVSVALRARPWIERFAGQVFHGDKVAGSVEAQAWKRVQGSAYWEEGGEVNFDPAAPFRAWGRELDLAATVHPNDNLAIELSGTRVNEWRDRGGPSVFVQDLARARVAWQFDRALALRLIGAWESLELPGSVDNTVPIGPARDFTLNALASYTPHPGTVFYLGYDDGYDDPAEGVARAFHRQSRALFFKASYLWRRSHGRHGFHMR